jgi:hypothetical protein
MDAHDKLFYRLNDPDPHTQAMAELDLLDEIFGGNFVERWLTWNGLEDELRGMAVEAPSYFNPNFFISSSNRGSCLRGSALGSARK